MRIAPQSFLAVSVFTIAGLVGWAGCSSNGPQGSVPPTATKHSPKHHPRAGLYPSISHIFVIIQENRSLNNLFAGANITGAGTTMTGEKETSSGGEVPITLHSDPLPTPSDIDHCYSDAHTAVNLTASGKQMDGFNYETLESTAGTCPGVPTAGPNPYAYVQQSDVQPYWDIANKWVLASNFYPTELGPSFVAHLNLIAGTTEYKSNPATAAADYPESQFWGCQDTVAKSMRHITATETPGPYGTPPPCYNQFHTIADLLDCLYCAADQSAVPWKYYASTYGGGYIWSAFQAIKRVYGNGTGYDWTHDVISPDGQVLKDIPAGNLDNTGVVWVVPQYQWSDHAGPGSKDWGPSWVGDIVNEIGARPALWNNSVIVVLWDDWGGWYDPAPPPTLDFRGYGIRTPMLIISPYAKAAQTVGHVSQEQFEPGSILRFIEQVFFSNAQYPNGETLGDLPCSNYEYYYYYGCGLGYTDGSAHSIGDVLNTSQAPRPYGTPIKTKYGPGKFDGGSGYGSYYSGPPPDDQ
jgi:phospholipase C